MRRRHQTNQTFVKFYCEDSDGIAPVGAQRVGKIIRCDGKQGCTVMLVVEMFSNTMLAPFIVLKGQTDKTLDKQWSTHKGFATVKFQPKH